MTCKILNKTDWNHLKRSLVSKLNHRNCPKYGGLSEVGVPHPKGRENHHTTTLPPESGHKSTVFSVPSLRPQAGWLVARLLLSGDVERNPVPGKKWLCTLCSLQNKTKSQTSIRCNLTTTHWVHLTCTNITATQYTNTLKCAQHSTHNSNPTSTLQK